MPQVNQRTVELAGCPEGEAQRVVGLGAQCSGCANAEGIQSVSSRGYALCELGLDGVLRDSGLCASRARAGRQ